MALKPIQIAGGGLAGLTLGIGLRQRGIPVVIWEAGRYPRHRVCGEFISGHGQDTLERLGLLKTIFESAGRKAETVAFFSEGTASRVLSLPRPALCISRFVLDEGLARLFQELGGELRENQRWREHEKDEGVVRASGRRIYPKVDGWRWLGLKVHAQGISLGSDLEMHLIPEGYVGLCQLNGEVNICGLFRSRTPLPDLLGRWRDYFQGTTGSFLRRRFDEARFDEASLCAVAGLSFYPRYGGKAEDCSIGDAFTMIPPVTGNGMSMAFESAELAIESLENYSRGKQSWNMTQRSVSQRCSEAFRARLWSASWLQKALFHPPLRATLGYALNYFPQGFAALFAHTR
jgi:flavin-dependent dehydrogenase